MRLCVLDVLVGALGDSRQCSRPAAGAEPSRPGGRLIGRVRAEVAERLRYSPHAFRAHPLDLPLRPVCCFLPPHHPAWKGPPAQSMGRVCAAVSERYAAAMFGLWLPGLMAFMLLVPSLMPIMVMFEVAGAIVTGWVMLVGLLLVFRHGAPGSAVSALAIGSGHDFSGAGSHNPLLVPDCRDLRPRSSTAWRSAGSTGSNASCRPARSREHDAAGGRLRARCDLWRPFRGSAIRRGFELRGALPACLYTQP